VTVFPGEIYRAPRSWAERNYHQLIYWNQVDKSGHLAAFEQPEIFRCSTVTAAGGWPLTLMGQRRCWTRWRT
jgi:hypothetical protein